MGRLFIQSLEGRLYTCRQCETQLARADEVLSKSFHSRNGKAYLFNSVVNTWPGKQEERTMTTGRHVVEDLHCVYCMQLVGWTYVSAEEPGQKYKEGKAILERNKVLANDPPCPVPRASITFDTDDDSSS